MPVYAGLCDLRRGSGIRPLEAVQWAVVLPWYLHAHGIPRVVFACAWNTTPYHDCRYCLHCNCNYVRRHISGVVCPDGRTGHCLYIKCLACLGRRMQRATNLVGSIATAIAIEIAIGITTLSIGQHHLRIARSARQPSNRRWRKLCCPSRAAMGWTSPLSSRPRAW